MNQSKPCKFCGKFGHYPYRCRLNPKKPNRISRFGKRAREYATWRDDVAKPYLIAKNGYKCALCGSNGIWLDVDHIQKRGSHQELKMELSNVRLVCRPCHIDIT